MPQIGKGFQRQFDLLCLRLVLMAAYRLAQNVNRTQPFHLQLTAAGFELSHFDQVRHQIVELFGFFFRAAYQIHLQWPHLARVSARQRIKRKPQALQGIA